jgi:hypothetical protein
MARFRRYVRIFNMRNAVAHTNCSTSGRVGFILVHFQSAYARMNFMILCFVHRAYYYEFKSNQKMQKLIGNYNICRGDMICLPRILCICWFDLNFMIICRFPVIQRMA